MQATDKTAGAFRHIPVMTDEIIQHLSCAPGKIIVDCTLGGGGHSQAVLDRILPGGRLIAIDRDRDAVENARKRFPDRSGDELTLINGVFSDLPRFLSSLGIRRVDGIVADLGVSLYQLEAAGRGFSFMRNEPLDMRMGEGAETTAETLIHTLSADELSEIFRTCGEERFHRRIAGAVVRARGEKKIETSAQLAEIVARAVPGSSRAASRIHPATRTFMALRIAVNGELDHIRRLVEDAPGLLKPGGRLCMISFHSLEDRIVKQGMRDHAKGCECPPAFPVCVCGKKPVMRVLTRKAVMPTEAEMKRNPMSRSARMRAAERI